MINLPLPLQFVGTVGGAELASALPSIFAEDSISNLEMFYSDTDMQVFDVYYSKGFLLKAEVDLKSLNIKGSLDIELQETHFYFNLVLKPVNIHDLIMIHGYEGQSSDLIAMFNIPLLRQDTSFCVHVSAALQVANVINSRVKLEIDKTRFFLAAQLTVLSILDAQVEALIKLGTSPSVKVNAHITSLQKKTVRKYDCVE